MHASIITSTALFVLATAQSTTVPVTGVLGNAEIVKDNPIGLTFKAVLPEKAWSYPGPQGNVQGSISAVAKPDGVGVEFKVDFKNLPKTGGPFMYHLHVAPVPEDGNCTKTQAHLDPYIRGEVPICDGNHHETCQVGDLSGKHGNLTEDPFQKTYHDKYASTLEGLGSFFGNRSVVVHFANKTRITCANFVVEAPVSTNTTGNGTVPYTTPTSTPVAYIPGSGAVGNMASVLSVLSFAGLIAFLI